MRIYNRDLRRRLRKHDAKYRGLQFLVLGIILALNLIIYRTDYTWFYKANAQELPDLWDQSHETLQIGEWYQMVGWNYFLDSISGHDADHFGNYYITDISDYTFLMVYIPDEQCDIADAIVDDTWRYLNEETNTLSPDSITDWGQLKRMDSDLKEQYLAWFSDIGYTQDMVNEVASYYYLDLTAGSSLYMHTLFHGFWLLIFLIALIVVWIGGMTGIYRRKLTKDMKKHNIDPDALESDLQRGKSFKYADFGTKYAVSYERSQQLIDYRDLTYVYPHWKEVSNNNRIGTDYKVRQNGVFMCTHEKKYFLRAKNEAEAQDIMRFLSPYISHIINNKNNKGE